MKLLLGGKLLPAVALAVLLVGGAWSTAVAEQGQPNQGRARQQVVLAGVIHAIEDTEAGRLLTLQKAGAPDVQVLVTDETRIVPPTASPELGDVARAIVQKPAGRAAVPVAMVLNLAKGARLPQGPQEPRQKHVCGVISGLPDDVHDGLWTVAVPSVADYELIVTPDTRITPTDATPAVGDAVCFVARQATEGWLAVTIHLDPRPTPGEPRRERKTVVVQGTVAALPEDRSADWVLTVAVAGAQDQDVLVTAMTMVDGELAIGARVVLQAEWVVDPVGTGRTLVAKRIKVLPEPAKRHLAAAVRFQGLVTAAEESSWTVELEDGTQITVGLDARTAVIGLAAGDSPVGRRVEGSATRAADGSLLARILRLQSD